MNVEFFMNEAIIEAKKALQYDEVPVGAIIAKDGEIIARSHNTRETTQVSTNHAEIIAINKACEILKTWRLEGCEMYVTLEPCIMCAGSLILSRIEKVYFGAFDPKSGSIVSVANVLDNKKYNHNVIYQGGILEEECSSLLKDFFKKLRVLKND
ncbi:MAG: cytidine/deoxycytidylate deaminase family protein zinc-binding protein [Haloplasmataceae bacterium]|jgi:tRNA(adenine34) deaminase|nr:cytidine/deoxycytidylate deaminase family protein zinc-binding protein [Haloplasmataceae bacterium]